MAWYFGQVLLIKWCLTKSPTFIFYPWNDNRWVLDTVLKTQVLAINVWENIFEPLNAVKTSWHCQLDNRSTFKVILYTRQFFSFLIFLFHSAQWAVLILPNLWYVGLGWTSVNATTHVWNCKFGKVSLVNFCKFCGERFCSWRWLLTATRWIQLSTTPSSSASKVSIQMHFINNNLETL